MQCLSCRAACTIHSCFESCRSKAESAGSNGQHRPRACRLATALNCQVSLCLARRDLGGQTMSRAINILGQSHEAHTDHDGKLQSRGSCEQGSLIDHVFNWCG